jgi:hypothetical protein
LWQGTDPGGASYPARVVYLKLRQTGDIGTGIACYSFERRENVGSKYPYVKLAGGWEGKLERSGEIVSTKISGIERFVRTDSQPSYC